MGSSRRRGPAFGPDEKPPAGGGQPPRRGVVQAPSDSRACALARDTPRARLWEPMPPTATPPALHVVRESASVVLDGPLRHGPTRPRPVSRPRLVRRLSEAPGAAVAALVAPAGYGKTTLIAEWAERDPRPFAWLTLEPEHDDESRLLEAIADRVCAAPPSSEPVVLVLDDAHVLRARRALEAVTVLADHLPPGSLLVVAARAEPALPLGRMRAQG